MVFELGTTQAFMDQLFTLPMAQIRQINRKVEILRQDPHPDGHQRKLLKHQKHRIYRLRSGAYRVLYHFNDTFVRLLGVDARSAVYDGIDDFAPDDLPAIEPLAPIDLDEPLAPRPGHVVNEPWLAANTVSPDSAKPELAAPRPEDLLTRAVTPESGGNEGPVRRLPVRRYAGVGDGSGRHVLVPFSDSPSTTQP